MSHQLKFREYSEFILVMIFGFYSTCLVKCKNCLIFVIVLGLYTPRIDTVYLPQNFKP